MRSKIDVFSCYVRNGWTRIKWNQGLWTTQECSLLSTITHVFFLVLPTPRGSFDSVSKKDLEVVSQQIVYKRLFGPTSETRSGVPVSLPVLFSEYGTPWRVYQMGCIGYEILFPSPSGLFPRSSPTPLTPSKEPLLSKPWLSISYRVSTNTPVTLPLSLSEEWVTLIVVVSTPQLFILKHISLDDQTVKTIKPLVLHLPPFVV